ncbi:hypothetical protein N1851_026032 [Merluccius polli]|uniref:CCHC-type domain-containing protein n=1 Tax=Merluccius polli TaxID=89951 RepID=A0AA47MCR8_MERPO|nr:hypothetical protein N1851_026032 [Merluccius polli]
MEEEMQDLRELVLQLRADNERLRHGGAASPGGSGGASSASPGPAGHAAPAGATAAVTERLVVIPRDRRCPLFNGKIGISITEWVEEIQACIRVRHLSTVDQAFFIFDHLEGEAKEEIKYRTSAERSDPAKLLAILKELYGCAKSYVTLQQAFFSRKQQEGETLLEFSLALMALMEQVKQCAPDGLLNSEVLLRDQFVEHVLDSALRRELKQLVRRQPTATLLEVRGEGMRWEREGFPGGARERSHSLPSMYGLQYGVQGSSRPALPASPPSSELGELKELLRRQQEQLNQLTHTVASMQTSGPPTRLRRHGPVICLRCRQPGHFARDCEGERARAGPVAGPPSTVARPASSRYSEN